MTRDIKIPSSSPLYGVEPLPPAILKPSPADVRSIWISRRSSRNSVKPSAESV